VSRGGLIEPGELRYKVTAYSKERSKIATTARSARRRQRIKKGKGGSFFATISVQRAVFSHRDLKLKYLKGETGDNTEGSASCQGFQGVAGLACTARAA
jgi:hypothetical protein